MLQIIKIKEFNVNIVVIQSKTLICIIKLLNFIINILKLYLQ